MTVQPYGPAQKEKDVNSMVNYAKMFDKEYAEKLASDTLINNARRQKQRQKQIPSLKSCPSVPAPPRKNGKYSNRLRIMIVSVP